MAVQKQRAKDGGQEGGGQEWHSLYNLQSPLNQQMQQHCQQELRRVKREMLFGVKMMCETGHRRENQHVTQTQWRQPDTHDTLYYQVRNSAQGTTWLNRNMKLVRDFSALYVTDLSENRCLKAKGIRAELTADSTSEPQANSSHPFTYM